MIHVHVLDLVLLVNSRSMFMQGETQSLPLVAAPPAGGQPAAAVRGAPVLRAVWTAVAKGRLLSLRGVWSYWALGVVRQQLDRWEAARVRRRVLNGIVGGRG